MASPNSFTGTTAGIGALGTVVVGTPVTGQVLVWDGNEWTNANVTSATGGTVSSIGIVGGTSGMTFSNSPITSSGTMTMSGTLVVGSGGTGLNTLTAGRIPFGAGTSPLASTDNLFFDSANNRLGVLTNSPELSLHVGNSSTGLNNLALFESGDAAARISFKDSSTSDNDTVGIGALGDNLRLFSGDSPSAILDSNQNFSVGGSVRIGNTGTPVAPLQINATTSRVGFLTSTQSNAYFEFFDTTTSGINYVNVGATGDNLTFKSNNVGYRWATADGSNGQVLTTDGSGNLSFTTVSGGTSLTVREVDGTPSVSSVDTIVVSNGTLTDDGGGQVTITTGGGGGGGSGTVTSVAMDGGTTGLTYSGSPITTSGTITLGGTLAVANGGTGSTTASGARTNLGLGTMATQNANAVAITGGTITGVSGVGSPSTGSANQFNVADGSGGWDSAAVYYHTTGSGGIKIGNSGLPNWPINAQASGSQSFIGRFVTQASQCKLSFMSSSSSTSAVAFGAEASQALIISNATEYLFPSSDGSSGDVLTTDGSGNLSFTDISGRSSFSVSPGTSNDQSVTISDSRVTATNTIVFSLEGNNNVSFSDDYISARSSGTSFTITFDAFNSTAASDTAYCNYMIL